MCGVVIDNSDPDQPAPRRHQLTKSPSIRIVLGARRLALDA